MPRSIADCDSSWQVDNHRCASAVALSLAYSRNLAADAITSDTAVANQPVYSCLHSQILRQLNLSTN